MRMPDSRIPKQVFLGQLASEVEVLTAIIGQRASILQCLDRPIENALGAVKLVKVGGKKGKALSDFDH